MTHKNLSPKDVSLDYSRNETGRFASLVSHTLKNSLQVIHIQTMLLEARHLPALGKDGSARIKTISRLIETMKQQLDGLHHYARVGRQDFQLVKTDLNELVATEIAQLQKEFKSAAVEIALPQPLPVVYCDRSTTAELIHELIVNAIKFNDKLSKHVEIGVLPTETSNHTTLYVRDNGIGIAENDSETIFEIFKRLHHDHEYGGGHGTGLAVARKIVESHGGRIWSESTPGEGSTFFFTMPARA